MEENPYQKYLAREGALLPQEQMVEVTKDQKGFSIGVPTELEFEENRIALIPDAALLLVNNGHEVIVQHEAGKSSKFSDREFTEAGASIAYSNEELYKKSNVIIKVQPPTLEEIELIQPGSVVISALQVAQISTAYINALNQKRITAFAFEMLEDEVGGLPIVRAMSEIAGSTVMLIAAEYLNSYNDGRGIILGGITGVPPTKVVIIGAGTAAEYAARTALGLGAEVKIFDNQMYKLRRIKQELGYQIFTSIIDHTVLIDALKRADVVIGAMRAEDGRSPCIVSEEMVSVMKEDSVIVDVSIDQGGCFETSEVTTHSRPWFKKFGVTHYCVPNIPSRVAHTASTALSNILAPMLIQAQELGGIEEMIFAKDWVMKGVYTHKGSLTARHIAKRLNLKYKDLNLFRISRF